MDVPSLIKAAIAARSNAYTPYSNFAVGAAVLSINKRVFTGCNVENLSSGLTICAERSAISAAVSDGYREFLALVIVADSNEPISPCGACRQVLAEFAPDIPIFSANLKGDIFESNLSYLLPRAKVGILNS